jgi:tryptophanyl-tRNA synthetase
VIAKKCFAEHENTEISSWRAIVKRVFSGIQPTGDIHVGNYLGAIKNWVKLIDEYDCIYCIVDYHAMTIPYEPSLMPKRVFDAALVNIACGLDPERCTVFIQSHVPEHTELTWFFNCITPIGDLERMTQFKQKAREYRQNINTGLLDYPILQAADILIYKAHYVPVGVDQVQHVELTRDIARRFNQRFGEIFPEPQVLQSPTPKILGLDGKAKMSKSLNNYIGMLEPADIIWEKLRTATTDVRRVRRSDPGNPEDCNLFTLHQAFTPQDRLQAIRRGCETAQIGGIECKRELWKNMMVELEPIQEKAKSLQSDPKPVKEALLDGASRCRAMAQAIMQEVRLLVGLVPLATLKTG